MQKPEKYGGPETQVLVVEDSPFNRSLLGQMVRKMGFKVDFAENGREGVEKVKALQPDIVLMDIHMPEMDGIQASSIIKNLEDIPYTPIMFVSSGIELDELRSAIETGGDDYIQRPFPYELLEAKIIAHLRTSELYRQVAAFSEARAREEELAENLFSNAVEYGNVDDPNIQVFKRAADVFSGDVQLTARRPNGDVNLLLGDFTGHGLMASIGALPLSETFRTMTAKGFEGSAILKQINTKMHKLLPTHMFLALTMVTLTTEGQVTVWNLGLPDAYLLEEGRLIKRIVSSAPPLGILRDVGDLQSERFQLDSSHELLLVSDGVIEATNPAMDLFGEERMLHVIEGNFGRLSTIDTVVSAVEGFMDGTAQADDITLVCLSGEFQNQPVAPVQTAKESKAKPKLPVLNSDDFWTWEVELAGKSLIRIDPVAQAISRLTNAEGDKEEWQSVFTILTELYVNALDHGVLGLDSSLKKTPDGFARYFDEREKRMENLKSGSVKLAMKHMRFEEGA